jgi:hypothetical protein
MSNDSTTVSYTPGGADDPRNPFHYMPTMAPTVVALTCFTIIFVALSVWTIRKRTWYMITLLVGCLMEILGYGMRIPLVSQPVGQIALYAGMNGLIIIAPVFNAAIEYVLFGRLMHAVGDQYSLLKPKLVSWIFIICDIFSLVIQVSGAGLLATASTNPDSATTGENILLGGLGVNLVSFAIFCLQLFYFDYRTRKSPPNFPCGSLCQKGWRQFLYVIYISSALVLLRQIYRVIEFSQGFTGYLATHEAFFFVFDAIPIFLSATIFVIYFPGNGYLPKNPRDTFDTMYNLGGNYKEENKGNVVVPANNVIFEGNF